MPVVVDTDTQVLDKLLTALPPGGHALDDLALLDAWLAHRPDEYVVVLGASLPLDAALATCEELRLSRPTTSVVLVREQVDTATLTRAMHAGVRDVVPREDVAAVSAAVERARQLWAALRGTEGVVTTGKVVTVFSPKGGVGKTTVAVNLALALADRGTRRVCVVDLDLAFGDVAITLQLFPTHTIEHAVGGEHALDFALAESLLTRHEDAVMVLAAPSLPDARDRVTPVLVAKMLRTLKEHFDFVVVDTAPAFDEQTLTALDETDECVVVATLDVPTLKNVKVALETLDMLHAAVGHRHLLLNRADDAVGIDPAKVEAILGMPVSARISTDTGIAAATNAGRPIVLAQPEHPASRAVRTLATTVGGASVAAPAATGSGTGHETERARRFRIRR
ncbi:AAA family ATPase [Nocardioides perillae]|uniref:Pilus assembly protein CpaE n=1 Tax=Nocardioides perillae TaxID=1119534 RepID=A0A7Y9RY77_9ACTN|nr:AAA family ATPase [Nocardioides perillae]NYG56289.1 pilus assembly protein CpaE [Nocardioides perillae]